MKLPEPAEPTRPTRPGPRHYFDSWSEDGKWMGDQGARTHCGDHVGSERTTVEWSEVTCLKCIVQRIRVGVRP